MTEKELREFAKELNMIADGHPDWAVELTIYDAYGHASHSIWRNIGEAAPHFYSFKVDTEWQ